GALRMDDFTSVLTLFCAVAGVVSILATLVGDGNRRPGGEFYGLVLAAVLGMSVLSAAVDMVTLYLSFELVSLTGYVLVGMRRADRAANEASLKYVLFGAVSSGLMLYGLSLLFGLAGLVRVLGALEGAPGTANPVTTVLPWHSPLAQVLAVSAVLTMTVGNLAACRQNDLKRLLAYSSIAHAGYMLMALSVWSHGAL